MLDVESKLRATLVDRADAAPPVGTLLTDVHQRSRRQRRHRAGLAGAAALAVAVVAAALAPQLLTGRGGAGPAIEPGTQPATVVTHELVPPSFTAPVFPFISTAGPPGFEAPRTRLDGGEPLLSYVRPHPGAVADALDVIVGDTAPACATVGDPVAVRGTTGRVHQDAQLGRQVLCWQEGATQWVRIVATPSVSLQTMTSVAEGLRPGTVPITVPFAFDLLPAGLLLDDMGETVMSFRPTDRPRSPSAFDGELAVFLNEEGEPDLVAPTVDVAGKPGWIHSEEMGQILNVRLGSGLMLSIQVPESLRMSEADLVRLGAGIRVLPGARPGHG
jgi:hypothetical protein